MLVVLIFAGTIQFKNKELQEGFKGSEEHPKIAFCFLTVGDVHKPHIWATFLKGKENLYNIYVHPKYPDRIKSFLKNHIIPSYDHVSTKWGDISLVRATLKLFKNALADHNNKMFVLVSDSCIPIRNFDFVYSELIADQSNIISSHSQQNSYTVLRYKQLKDQKFLTKSQFKKVSQWLAVNQKTAHFLVTNDYTDLYRNMFCPDEHYFANVLDKFNKPYNDRKLTCVDWNNPSLDPKYRPYPKTFTKLELSDIKKCRTTGALFLRKIVPETKVSERDLFEDQSSNISIVSI